MDYIAAINRRCSEGITPENNAVVPFCRALGPKKIDLAIRKRFFESLGIPVLPEEGDYLVTFHEFFPEYGGSKSAAEEGEEDPSLPQEISEQFDRVQLAPWSADEYPAVAALLEKNNRPLQWVVEGARRPRFFAPLLPRDDEDFLSCEFAPIMAELRQVVRQLRARAMLRLGQGRLSDAWANALTCHQVARLAGKGPLIVDALILVTLEGLAYFCTVRLAQHGAITAEQARHWQSDSCSLTGQTVDARPLAPRGAVVWTCHNHRCWPCMDVPIHPKSTSESR